MSLLNKIRNKPQHEKIRLVWIIAIITLLLMITLWVLIGHINKNTPKDLRFFQSIAESFRSINNDFQSRLNK